METYFITIAGVSAALTGLIFVSLSINLHQILAFKHLPSRAFFRILTYRHTKYCGAREPYECQLYLSIEDIYHTKTKAKG